MLLIRWQAAHAVPTEQAMDGGPRNRDLMKSFEIVGHTTGLEVGPLSKVQNLAYDRRRRRAR